MQPLWVEAGVRRWCVTVQSLHSEEAVTGGVLCDQCSPLDQAETPCIFHQAQNRYHSPTQPSKPYRD
jgi:hypothetical protein